MSDDKDITLPSYERAATIHPESYGHWDRAQISDLLHERDALRTTLEGIRDSLRCTKQAPSSYDADHHCSYCGTTLAYSKEAIDAALAAKEKP